MSATKDWIYGETQEKFRYIINFEFKLHLKNLKLNFKFELNRKYEFYSLNWNIENIQLIPASFGGPIGKKITVEKFEQMCYLYSNYLFEKHVSINQGFEKAGHKTICINLYAIRIINKKLPSNTSLKKTFKFIKFK